MYLKICRQLDGEHNETIVECDTVRTINRQEEPDRIAFMVEKHGTPPMTYEVDQNMKSQVYLMGDDGRTVEVLHSVT